MHILLVYLVGCLVGLGIVGSFINAKLYEYTAISAKHLLFYGTICSWLTVLFFIFGMLRGLLNEEDDDY